MVCNNRMPDLKLKFSADSNDQNLLHVVHRYAGHNGLDRLPDRLPDTSACCKFCADFPVVPAAGRGHPQMNGLNTDGAK